MTDNALDLRFLAVCYIGSADRKRFLRIGKGEGGRQQIEDRVQLQRVRQFVNVVEHDLLTPGLDIRKGCPR